MHKKVIYYNYLILLATILFLTFNLISNLTVLNAKSLPKQSFIDLKQTSPFGFLKATAQINDDVKRFLKRYQMYDNQCNLDFFYEQNNLNKSAYLVVGKKYYLPVYVYPFDNNSIRSTIGIYDWPTARRIQQYNTDMRKINIRKEKYTESGQLWVPYNEIDCNSHAPKAKSEVRPNVNIYSDYEVESPIPTVKITRNPSIFEPKKREIEPVPQPEPSPPRDSNYRRYAIFGEEHAYVPLENSELKDAVFYIVSGHGGPDPGAVGKYAGKNVCEDEYAYDISLRLARNLIKNGATTYMITRDDNDGIRSGEYLPCDKDETCWKNEPIFESHKKRLYQRSDAINKLYYGHLEKKKSGYQRAIMLHIDSRAASQQADIFFYHFPGSSSGKKLAKSLHYTVKEKYRIHQSSRGYHGTITSRDLHMLRETRPVSAYIELGNIANNRDQQRFVVEDNRQALADWLFEGLRRNYRAHRLEQLKRKRKNNKG